MNETAFFVDTFLDKYFPILWRINGYPVLGIFWNLFLLLVPFFICLFLIKLWKQTKFQEVKYKVTAIFWALLWLIFIPNAPYIISDVRHLLNYCPVDSVHNICSEGAWLIMFFFIYASIGWVSYVFLINQMKYLIKSIWGNIGVNFYIWLISPIVSLGLLLGLINRWNSWEIFIHPIKFLQGAWMYFFDLTYLKNWIIYTISLYLLYFIGDLIFTFKIFYKKIK